jgi:hypothetical protein
MLFGAVALVTSQAITGVMSVKLDHDTVTGDLGDNRSAGDGEAQLVTSGYPLLRDGELGKGQPVYEQKVGRAG